MIFAEFYAEGVVGKQVGDFQLRRRVPGMMSIEVYNLGLSGFFLGIFNNEYSWRIFLVQRRWKYDGYFSAV